MSILTLKHRLPLLSFLHFLYQQNIASIFRVINSKSTASHFTPTSIQQPRIFTCFPFHIHSTFAAFLSFLHSAALDASDRGQSTINRIIPVAQLQLLMRKPMLPLRFQLPKPVQVELSHKALELAMPEVQRNDFFLHFIEVADLDDRLVVGPVYDVGVVMVLSGRWSTSSKDYSLLIKFPILAQAFIFENSIINHQWKAGLPWKEISLRYVWGGLFA